jgi:predicted GIY-YIG superfamily endonuclease
MKQYYVYELINHYGTIEYVGETTIPKIRMNKHTKAKPGFGNGKFYGRQDLIMNIVAVFDNRKQARELEGKLKLDYGMEWTEITSGIKGGKIQGRKSVENGNLDKARIISIEKRKRAILQYSRSGDFIKEWDSSIAVEKQLEKVYAANITLCCKGKLKSAGGYMWKYKQQ